MVGYETAWTSRIGGFEITICYTEPYNTFLVTISADIIQYKKVKKENNNSLKKLLNWCNIFYEHFLSEFVKKTLNREAPYAADLVVFATLLPHGRIFARFAYRCKFEADE